MGAHYCTNGGKQRAARGVAPCRHTAAATHRCPPLPSAAHFHAHAMPQLYSSIRSWAVTPFSFAAKMPASPSNCREPWPPKPKQRVRPELRHVAQRAKFAKKVHKPPLRVNVINFELKGFNAPIWVPWSPSDPKKLWCTDRSIQLHKKQAAFLNLYRVWDA